MRNLFLWLWVWSLGRYYAHFTFQISKDIKPNPDISNTNANSNGLLFLLTVACAPGTYSSNGVEPCSPCPVGTYQSKTGQITCLPCPGVLSTHGTGASSTANCKGKLWPPPTKSEKWICLAGKIYPLTAFMANKERRNGLFEALHILFKSHTDCMLFL